MTNVKGPKRVGNDVLMDGRVFREGTNQPIPTGEFVSADQGFEASQGVVADTLPQGPVSPIGRNPIDPFKAPTLESVFSRRDLEIAALLDGLRPPINDKELLWFINNHMINNPKWIIFSPILEFFDLGPNDFRLTQIIDLIGRMFEKDPKSNETFGLHYQTQEFVSEWIDIVTKLNGAPNPVAHEIYQLLYYTLENEIAPGTQRRFYLECVENHNAIQYKTSILLDSAELMKKLRGLPINNSYKIADDVLILKEEDGKYRMINSGKRTCAFIGESRMSFVQAGGDILLDDCHMVIVVPNGSDYDNYFFKHFLIDGLQNESCQHDPDYLDAAMTGSGQIPGQNGVNAFMTGGFSLYQGSQAGPDQFSTGQFESSNAGSQKPQNWFEITKTK